MQNRKQWLWGVLAILSILVGALAYYWYVSNEALSIQVKKTLREDMLYQPALSQHAYFMLLGMNAGEVDNPVRLGALRYHYDWRKFIKQPNIESNDNATHAEQNVPIVKLSESEVKMLNALRETYRDHPEKFTQEILSQQKQWLALTSRYSFLIDRFDWWIQQNPYVSLVTPSNSQYPDYGFVLDTFTLSIIEIGLMPRGRLNAYANLFQKLQQFDQQRLSLAEKMLVQHWISVVVDLMRYEQLRSGEFLQLTLPQKDNIGFDAALDYELMEIYSVYQELSSSETGLDDSFTKLFNRNVALYMPFYKLSHQPYHELKANFLAEEWKPNLKNLYFVFLKGVDESNVFLYEKNILRNHVIQNKIYVFNALNTPNWNVQQLNQNTEGRFYFEKDGMLCIEIPYPKEKIESVKPLPDSCLVIQ